MTESRQPPRPDGSIRPGKIDAESVTAPIRQSGTDTDTGLGGLSEAVGLPANEPRGPAVGGWRDSIVAGRYRIQGLLGEGGMGEVYRAYDENLKTDVVLKVPKRECVADKVTGDRFEREIRSLVRLSHPHVVSIMDVGRHNGVPFAVMPFLEGGSLDGRRRRLEGGGHVPLGAVAAIGRWVEQIGKALDFVHQSGYLHRDVKPGNILFDRSGNAYLSDFGVVKFVNDTEQQTDAADLTATGSALGTAPYLAPEVLVGKGATPAADQYALAVTVFELICGRKPFVGTTRDRAIFSRLGQPAPDLTIVHKGVPPRLAEVVAKALASDPADRFPSCESFAEELLAAMPLGELAAATPGSPTFACPCCNQLLDVGPELAAQPFSCAHCSKLLVAHPRLVWIEPAAQDPARIGQRYQQLRAVDLGSRTVRCPACLADMRVVAGATGKGGCPTCEATLRLSANGATAELLAGPAQPVFAAAPRPFVPAVPMPPRQPELMDWQPDAPRESSIPDFVRKGDARHKRRQHEQERRRKEHTEVITGVVSLVFLAVVGYLFLAALGWL
jgi:tRNA A-37 threonylcarbamoyl transferase component Bud32